MSERSYHGADGRGGQREWRTDKREDGTAGTYRLSSPSVYTTAIESLLGCHATVNKSAGPFQITEYIY